MEPKTKKLPIINIHTHIFTNKNVPNQYINLLYIPLVPLLRSKLVTKLVDGISFITSRLKKILPFFSLNINHEYIDRFSRLLSIGGHESQASIFQILQAHYPPDAKFVILSLNMKFMGAGRITNGFGAQIKNLAALKKLHSDQVIPFYHVDPREDNIIHKVKEHVIDPNGAFHGIKLYPSLGYFPFPFPNTYQVDGKEFQTSHAPMSNEDHLEEIYSMAQEHNIPIITHVTPGGVLGRRRKYKSHPITGRKMAWYQSRPAYVYNFAHPMNYEYLLQKFPDLKICLAHFGGQAEWKRHLAEPLIHRGSALIKNEKDIYDQLHDPNSKFVYPAWNPTKQRVEELSWLSVIRYLMIKYTNVYADISYNAYTPDTLALLKLLINDDRLKEKILFGTDFHVLRIEKSEKEFSMSMRAFIGEERFDQIARINPAKFLERA